MIFPTKLVTRLPENIEIFKKLQLFSPKKCLRKIDRAKFIELPFVSTYVEKNNLGRLESQYNKLLDVNWEVIFQNELEDIDTYEFWAAVFNKKNASGQCAFR